MSFRLTAKRSAPERPDVTISGMMTEAAQEAKGDNPTRILNAGFCEIQPVHFVIGKDVRCWQQVSGVSASFIFPETTVVECSVLLPIFEY